MSSFDVFTTGTVREHVFSDLLKFIIEPGHEKICLMSFANNKGANQPAHPRSLINAFVFAA